VLVSFIEFVAKKLKKMIDIDEMNIRPMALADLNLADIANAKRLQTQNNYLSYAVVILGIAVFSLWHYASIKDAPGNKW